ncbi:MAG: PAS domain S-box protein [Bryobacterales bacterium]|nr:PAS domain S-box protein [Bryobacterales bacterium]
MQPEEIVNILLVDQDENRLRELENVLSSLDRNLVKAHSGEEASRALLDHDFAVVVADARMPGMDGFETAARPPVIFAFPADCSETHLARGCSLGAVDYIYTPIVPEILRAKVTVFVELKRQRERLEAEVMRNRFFTLSPGLLSIAGLDGYFRQLNPSWERTLGYTIQELKSKPFREFVHPDDREMALVATRRLAAGEIVHFEIRYLAKDGSHRWLLWNTAPDAEEQLIYAVAHDVTERKQAEAALVAANRELEAFSYSVSHDLRAPLRAIDGFSQALEEDCSERLDEAGRRHLERIRSAARYMGHLIDALLRLSRVARMELRRSVADLSKLARTVARDLEDLDPGRKVEFAIAEGVRAVGDANLLRVVLENLLGNAWKFTARREDARIEFGVETGGGGPVYRVRDNGAGFDMKHAGKLFSLFQRLHEAHEFPGTGIGLATVQRVVRRHGGRVWAESAAGQGTTIRFTLAGEAQTGEQDGLADSPGGEAEVREED